MTAYVGNVHFTRPSESGHFVEVHARIIYTGRTSMQVLVTVETTDVRERAFTPATHCILVFVAIDDAGKPREVPSWQPESDADRTLQSNAMERLEPRRRIQASMRAQEYTPESTAPRTVLRFLAALNLTTEQDQKLDAHARELMVMSEPMKTMPVNLVRCHQP